MTGESGTFKMYVSSSSGGGGCQGVQMVSTNGQTLFLSTEVAIEFDTGATEHPPSFDDFGLRSTGTIDIYGDGSVIIPTGSAVIIDAAHAGRWSFSAMAEIATNGGTSSYRQWFIKVNDDTFVDDFYEQIDATTDIAIDGECPITYQIYTLAEGDIVWCMALADPNGAIAGDVVFTMLFCG